MKTRYVDDDEATNKKRAAMQLLARITKEMSEPLRRHRSPEQAGEYLASQVAGEPDITPPTRHEDGMDISAATLKKCGTVLLICSELLRRRERCHGVLRR
jgi:hypothetical protein